MQGRHALHIRQFNLFWLKLIHDKVIITLSPLFGVIGDWEGPCRIPAKIDVICRRWFHSRLCTRRSGLWMTWLPDFLKYQKIGALSASTQSVLAPDRQLWIVNIKFSFSRGNCRTDISRPVCRMTQLPDFVKDSLARQVGPAQFNWGE